MGIVSYAQNFEDVLLNRIFASVHYAFYVDIGAYHPVTDSVTKTFYDRGWDGINVEPGDVFDELAAARPRDINLHMAVFDQTGTISFAQHPGWHAGLSHVQAEVPLRSEAVSSQPASETRIVSCDTLTNILNRYASGRPIAFLKIDAEGAEGNIIRSTDWRTIRPTVVLIEATKPRSTVLDNDSWEPTLLEQGYLRAYFDGINCFYVPEERADLLRHFEMPVNVLDGWQRFDPQPEIARASAVAAEARIAQLTAEFAQADAERTWQAEQAAAAGLELKSTHAQLVATRQNMETLIASQNDAVAAVVEANAYQLEELNRQLAELHGQLAHLRGGNADLAGQLAYWRGQNADLNGQLAHLHIGLAERDATLLSVRRERDALLRLRDEALRLRRLIRDLRWPDGPGALRYVLPLARLLRRLARTPIPPISPEEVASAPPSAPVAPAAAPPTPVRRRRSLARRAAWLAYQPLRPISRPIAHRLRSFLTVQAHSQFVQLDHKLDRLRDELARLPPPQQIVTGEVQVPDPRVAELQAEVRQFSKLLEDTLLTVAMDGSAAPVC